MKLIVGLGNPGNRYADTRHNIGFMAADAIADRHGFSPFRAKFEGQLAEGRLGGDKAWLLKPETYMNLSGQSVGEALRFFKLTAADVVVLHDELDLAPGRLRIKTGGGHAGHNGLRSLIGHIGADFLRVRLGIGHPGDRDRVSDYVLSPFAKADQDWLVPLLGAIAQEADFLARGDAPGFQTAVARRLAPPPASPLPRPQPLRQKPEDDLPGTDDDPLSGLMRKYRRDLDG
jgi:PTH1 family peptidyl-tRNA hydrolase